MLPFFASEDAVPLSAETIFTIGNFPITNSMIMGVLTAVIIMTIFGAMALFIKARPNSKFAFTTEVLAMFIMGEIKNNFMGDEKKARKFLGLFLAFFTFILINNLGGLLPGMGGSIYVETSEGIKAALLRPFTTDLNGTLALAFIAIATVQYFAIKQRGFFGHIKHYFSIMTPWWNPMNFFIGFIEILSELVRLLTLALRLFGVIYAGEVLLHVITNLAGNLAPVMTLPIILLEIFFSLIQAYLFIMLSSVYLAMGTAHDESHDKDDHSKDKVNKIAKSTAGAKA
ncbi:F0F1 ATP synthase subunit A [Candidatus Saccharibacteria bacterium]|nr:F0F1 ATP synthase subunit A [Candidatus Saccharibacteria bacterium]MBP7834628.1 F0F1 ATP synthase subunit A [Candidatus Saccharibacteria bacterium]